MGKRPSFQFYPNDWLRDTRGISIQARGAWVDLLCYMWYSPTPGVVSGNIKYISNLIQCNANVTVSIIGELDLNLIADVTNSEGHVTIINRRMEREQRHRASARYRVQKYRVTQMKRQCNANVTPPSSSSSSKEPATPDSATVQKSNSHPECQDIDYLLAEQLKENIIMSIGDSAHKDIRTGPRWEVNKPKWADTFRLMREQDGRHPEIIERMLKFVKGDKGQGSWPGWSGVILSPRNFREKWDKIYKQARHKGMSIQLSADVQKHTEKLQAVTKLIEEQHEREAKVMFIRRMTARDKCMEENGTLYTELETDNIKRMFKEQHNKIIANTQQAYDEWVAEGKPTE